tara:strand:+ start:12489 stop:13043 length:555 start_codon:yes stop_codon:yes gene_type:complete
MYATKNFDKNTMAKAQSISLPVSLKQSVEVCKFIQNKKYSRAVKILEDVKLMKIAVPYTRFNRGGTGHRKGMGPGRYPVKVCGYMLKLLRSVHANAGQKGLDTNNLIVKSVIAKQGPKTSRYGRKRGRTAKRTHLEIVLVENKKKTVPKKEADKTTMKNDAAKKEKPAEIKATDSSKKNETKTV